MNIHREIERHEKIIDVLQDIKIINRAIKHLNESQKSFIDNFCHPSKSMVELITIEEAELKELTDKYKSLI